MFIWVGIDVDSQFQDVKNRALSIDRELAFENSCFTLPMHISLKMSFPIKIAEKEAIIKTISDYYGSIEPFEVQIKGIEKDEEIIWIRMQENERLSKISYDLNHILQEKYQIGLHEYDLDYKFHTTLFMDDNREKIDLAFEKIKSCCLPQKLYANTFVIGVSNSGDLGTYSIYKTIIL